MEKIVKIGDRDIVIHEMKWLDFIEAEFKDSKRERQIAIFELHGVPKEITEGLSYKEGNILSKAINELDGLSEGFQKPSENEKKE